MSVSHPSIFETTVSTGGKKKFPTVLRKLRISTQLIHSAFYQKNLKAIIHCASPRITALLSVHMLLENCTQEGKINNTKGKPRGTQTRQGQLELSLFMWEGCFLSSYLIYFFLSYQDKKICEAKLRADSETRNRCTHRHQSRLWETLSMVSKVIRQKFSELVIKNVCLSWSVLLLTDHYGPGNAAAFHQTREIWLTTMGSQPFLFLAGNTLNSWVSAFMAINQRLEHSLAILLKWKKTRVESHQKFKVLLHFFICYP